MVWGCYSQPDLGGGLNLLPPSRLCAAIIHPIAPSIENPLRFPKSFKRPIFTALSLAL